MQILVLMYIQKKKMHLVAHLIIRKHNKTKMLLTI